MPGISSGTRFTDLANPRSSGHHAALVGMTNADWKGSSRLGSWGALQLTNGNTQRVEDIDGEDYTNGLTAATMAIWIKATTTGTDRGFIISTVPVGADAILSMRYDVAGGEGGGTNVIKIAFGGTFPDISTLESSENIQTTDWQHVLGTWRAGEAPSLYINGVFDVPTFTDTAGTVIVSATTFRMGQGGKGIGTGCWDGLMDDVHLWNRALSAVEVRQLYQLSLQGYPGMLNRIRIPRFVAAPAGGFAHSQVIVIA